MGKGKARGKKPKKGGKKLSAKERAERRETGGWGQESTPFLEPAEGEGDNDGGDAPRVWRRTAEQDDRVRRKRARKQMHVDQDNFVARMKEPMFERASTPSQKETKKKKMAEKRKRLAAPAVEPSRILSVRKRTSAKEEEDEDEIAPLEVDTLRKKGLLAFGKGARSSSTDNGARDANDDSDDAGDDSDSDSDDDDDDDDARRNPASSSSSSTYRLPPTPPVCSVGDTPEMRAAYDRFFLARSSHQSSASSALALADSSLGGSTRFHDNSQSNHFTAVAEQSSELATRAYRDSGATGPGAKLEILVAPGPSTEQLPAAPGSSTSTPSSLATAMQQCAPEDLSSPPPDSQELLESKFPTVNADSAIEVAGDEEEEEEEEGSGAQSKAEGSDVPPPLQHTLNAALQQYADALVVLPLVDPSSSDVGASSLHPPSLSHAGACTQNAVLSHVLHLVTVARSRVLDHNQKIRRLDKERRSSAIEAEGDDNSTGKVQETADKSELPPGTDGDNDGSWMRDQGFTRARILLLAPTRHVAWAVIQKCLDLLGPNTTVPRGERERFEAEYGPGEDDEDDNDEDADEDGEGDIEGGSKQKRGSAKPKHRKPVDWERVFGGNADDNFRMGIALTPAKFAAPPPKSSAKKQQSGKAERGAEFRLFQEFYHSDIIIASPLGLVLTVNSEGSAAEDHDDDVGQSLRKKKRGSKLPSADFLSSIEAVAVLDADVLAMQNWEHVLQVFELLNKRPAVDRGTDYARVRLHLLEDDASSSKENSSTSVPPGSRFRQTIILSSVLQSQVSGLFLRCCGSHAGKIRVRPVEGTSSSSAATLRVNHPQLFQRITCNSGFRGADDDRFAYVTKTVIPAMQRSKQARTLLFVPSYFDFVRIRNYLIELGQKFVAIHEYARPSEVSRSRSRFFQGRVPLMIYTGRAHFFSRYLIRGVSHLLFYSLPDHGHIYAELVGCLDEAKSSNMKTTSIALYTKYDSLCLAGIVGDDSARQMTTSQKSSFLFA